MSEAQSKVLWEHGSLFLEVTGNDELVDLLVMRRKGPAATLVLGQKFTREQLNLKDQTAYEYGLSLGKTYAEIFDTIREEAQ